MAAKSESILNEEALEELEVMESIYASDFKRVETAWGINVRFDLKLSSVTATFILSKSYPMKALDINIINNVKDISLPHCSSQSIIEINKIIKMKVIELEGNLMLYDISSHIEDFVKNNEIIHKDLYETMIEREKNEAETLAQLRKGSVSVNVNATGDGDGDGSITSKTYTNTNFNMNSASDSSMPMPMSSSASMPGAIAISRDKTNSSISTTWVDIVQNTCTEPSMSMSMSTSTRLDLSQSGRPIHIGTDHHSNSNSHSHSHGHLPVVIVC